MPLEPSEEQRRRLVEACAYAVGKVSVLAKGDYSPESVVSSLPLLLDVLWPLVRDLVLEEAAKACDEPTETQYASQAREIIKARLLAMKGDGK